MSDSEIRIIVIPNGPAQIKADRASITQTDGTVVKRDGDVFLCRCGHSKNKPFCDGSHKEQGFKG